jgi:porin
MEMSMRTALAILLGLAVAGAPGRASAQPVEVPETWGGDLAARPRATGSWGGLRDDLGRKGVVLDVDMLLTPQFVLDGGRESDAAFWGSVDYTLHVDTDKLGLWPGGFVTLMGSTSFGDSVSEAAGTIPTDAHALFPEFDHPDTGLLHATFMQFLSPKFGLVMGKMFMLDAAHGEFSGNYRTQFSNSAIVLPLGFALVPIAAYGGGVIALPWEGVVLSAMAIDPSGTVDSNDVSKAFDDGVMVLGSASVAVEPFGLRGHQNAGFMWSDKERLELEQDPSNLAQFLLTERFPKLGDPGPVLREFLERFFPELLTPVEPAGRKDDAWAAFYGFDQYLWQPEGHPDRGIGLFFTFGVADDETNPIAFSYVLGLGGNGVVPGRPDDRFGAAWARTEFSDDLLPFLRDRLPLGLDNEDAVELYYTAALTSWLEATLDLQVVEPALEAKLGSSGGLDDVDTTVIGGLRLYVRF